MRTRVIVVGAMGRMGRSAIETFLANRDKFDLVAAVVRSLKTVSSEIIQDFQKMGVPLIDNLEAELHKGEIDVLVELTTPDSVFQNSKLALMNGVRPVIGATGLTDDDINELYKLAVKAGVGAIIAPNFSVGAILMMKYAADAVKYMDRYEIIEMHHDQKLDAPSGTAIKTAKMMSAKATKPNIVAYHNNQAARGELHYGIPIHSIRLQGFVASQEVLLGGQGQTLSIRHDTIDRSSFMPGILLASEKVMSLNKLVYGLENVIN